MATPAPSGVRVTDASTMTVVVSPENLQSFQKVAQNIGLESEVSILFKVTRHGIIVAAHVLMQEKGKGGPATPLSVPVNVALDLYEELRKDLECMDTRGIDADGTRAGIILEEEEDEADEKPASTEKPTPPPKKTPVAKRPPSPTATPKSTTRSARVLDRQAPAVRNTDQRFKAAAEPSLELLEALERVDLGAYGELFRKIRITTLTGLVKFSLPELVDTLRQPAAAGAKYVMPPPTQRAFIELGLRSGADTSEPVAGAHSGTKAQLSAMKSKTRVGATHSEGIFAAMRGQSLGDYGDDEDDEGALDAPGHAPGYAPGKIRVSVGHETSTIGDALSDAPFASALLGDGAGLTESQLTDLVQSARALVPGATDFVTPARDAAQLIDRLDMLLEKAANQMDTVSLTSLHRVTKTPRAIQRFVDSVHLSVAQKPKQAGEQEKESTAVANVLLASMDTIPTSDKDLKLSEELSAARKRVDKVAASEGSCEVLAELNHVMASDSFAAPREKLAAFSKVISKDADVAQLIYSAHVREAKGTLAIVHEGRGKWAVERVWEIRTALLAAVRDVTRDLLPMNADASVLAEAVLKGELATKEGRKFNLKSVANPKSPPSWMGSTEVGPKEEEAGGKEAALIALLSVYPALVVCFQLAHPLDTSSSIALGEVMSEVCKGLKRSGVSTAVDHLLSPFMRELEAQWELFQKSATKPMPVLAEVWDKVKKTPSVTGYLAHASAPAAATNASSAACANGTFDKQFALITTAVEKLAKKVEQMPKRPKAHPPSRPGTPLASDNELDLGDKPDDAGPNWERNRRRRLDRSSAKPKKE